MIRRPNAYRASISTLLLLLAACSDPDVPGSDAGRDVVNRRDVSPGEDAGGDDSATADDGPVDAREDVTSDVGDDADPVDVVAADVQEPMDVFLPPDVQPMDVFVPPDVQPMDAAMDVPMDTPPTGGPIGTTCTRNGECSSMLCLAQGRCTQTCTGTTSCPASWTCSPLIGAGNVCQCTPMGTEVCDGIDNDCNARVDDGARCANTNQLCQAGRCVCPAANTCGTSCVNKLTDPAHCGACNNACGPGATCTNGACACPSGTTTCSGGCYNLTNSRLHCGACGTACAVGCSNSMCFTISEVRAGYDHTCAVRNDGQVMCWGRNDTRQLFDGTVTTRRTPVLHQGVSGVAQLAIGEIYSVALLTTGRIKYWGNNRTTVGDISGITTATQISGTADHFCARLADGTARCWGWNTYGQLGGGTATTNSTLTPVTVAGLNNVVQISAGYNRTCAVLTDGTVRCWGWDPNATSGSAPTLTPTIVRAGAVNLSNMVEVSVGTVHSCARNTFGEVYCWGRNGGGELGLGNMNYEWDAVRNPTLADVLEIDAGNHYSCARVPSGIRCWGSNYNGELGDGTRTPRTSPVAVTGISSAANVTVSERHTCAAVGTGVRCWGDNGYSKLGDGTTTDTSTPVSPAW